MLVELGSGALVAAVVVQAQDPAPPAQGPEYGTASPIALVVILLLALATAVLIRSMTKRIRRLPASFGPEQETGDDRAGPSTAADTATDNEPGDPRHPR